MPRIYVQMKSHPDRENNSYLSGREPEGGQSTQRRANGMVPVPAARGRNADRGGFYLAYQQAYGVNKPT
jgi:hypothetical protein